uniref:CR-type domain-containing protein n=1 Tax=Opuntia streptacantha TaxID=393608 RepID=A0A7C8YQX4_OPUST
MGGALQISIIRIPTCSLEPPPPPPSSSGSGSSSAYARPEDFLPRRTQNTHVHLSFSKPSLIVRTQSNVRIWRRKKAEPSCVVCNGSGRVNCRNCNGKGRTNHTDLAMLPKGEWPKWCRRCGGSGLGNCNRCFGTGKYTGKIGFRFEKLESNLSQDHS